MIIDYIIIVQPHLIDLKKDFSARKQNKKLSPPLLNPPSKHT